MKRVQLETILAMMLCVKFSQFVVAEEPAGVEQSLYPWHALVCPDALLRGCCDIYCPKPLPCKSCLCRGCGKVDYCGKPCPCVPCFRNHCTRDCYCRKQCPEPCRPLFCDYFTCPGWGAGCAKSASGGTKVALPAAQSEETCRETNGVGDISVSPASGQSN